MAELEPDRALAEIYRGLGRTEERHAAFWEEKLREAGHPVPARRPSRRVRVLSWVAGRLGPGVILPLVAAEERRGRFMYDEQPEAAGSGLPRDERSHARVLQVMTAARGGVTGGAIGRLEGRHRAVGGNALRAAVLGANDGLVSNLSLVMGVAGATLAQSGVLIAGLAGLIAGGLSMALGEWLSVQSSRELHTEEIETEREEIIAFPEEEEEELSLIYRAKGLPEELARQMAAHIMSNPDSALETLAREELGIDPETLGGSAWEAAVASFLLFTAGAAVPVIPFFFVSGFAAVVASLIVSGLALFVVGAGITLVTGRGLLRSGLRQVVFGLTAAAITFGIGRILGVAISG
jgi:VIT1/CCC1 family predicted Fe2+/Mn2+ transporter